MTAAWALVSAVALLGLLSYGFVLLWIGALWNYRLAHPRRLRVTRAPSTRGLPKDDLCIRLDGIGCLHGWTIASPQSKGTIVLCHHYRGNRQWLLPYAKFLYDAGFSSVLFDFLGHGESDEVPRLWPIAKALDYSFQAVLDEVRSLPIGRDGPLGLMGFSAGTVPILFCLLNGNGSSPVGAVVFDSGPPLPGPDLWHALMGRTTRLPGLPGFGLTQRMVSGWQNKYQAMHGLEKLDGVTTPMMFIHGAKDHIIPGTHSRSIYERLACAPKAYWEVPGAYHLTAFSLEKDRYAQRVVTFFSDHLR